jgi:hypothetical protein
VSDRVHECLSQGQFRKSSNLADRESSWENEDWVVAIDGRLNFGEHDCERCLARVKSQLGVGTRSWPEDEINEGPTSRKPDTKQFARSIELAVRCAQSELMEKSTVVPSRKVLAGADSEGFCTPVPIEFVHPFRSFCTPGEVVTPALA